MENNPSKLQSFINIIKRIWEFITLKNFSVNKDYEVKSKELESILVEIKDHAEKINKSLSEITNINNDHKLFNLFMKKIGSMTDNIIWATNNKGDIIYINETMLELLKILDSHKIVNINDICEKFKDTSLSVCINRMFSIKDIDNDVNDIVNCVIDAFEHIFKVRKTHILNENGLVVGYTGIIEDVTIRVKSLNRIKEITKSKRISDIVDRLLNIVTSEEIKNKEL